MNHRSTRLGRADIWAITVSITAYLIILGIIWNQVNR